MKVTVGLGKLNINDIASACGAEVVGNRNREICGVCTDSREAGLGVLFVALRGERTDGHKYIKNVIHDGCDTVLCEEVPYDVKELDCTFLVVKNSVNALSDIGKYYKNLISHKTVAITGSVGKTTTKEYVASVLKEKYSIYKTDGNYNSVIGMPLSMLEFDSNVEYAVLEMGMSGFGEIESMSRSAEPDIALITNIGTSHLEYLLTRENICRAKCEIACGLKKDGILIVNGDEPLLDSADKIHKNVLRVGIDGTRLDIRGTNIREALDGTLFDIEYNGILYKDIKLSSIGRHHVYAALFAFAVGVSSEVSENEIRRGLMNYTTVGMRQNIYQLRGFTVIEDCYNASPESMRAASEVLMSLAKREGGRAIALLGDMRELGEDTDRLHFELGEHFAHIGLDVLFTYGESAEKIADGAIFGGLSEERVRRNRDVCAPNISGEAILREIKPGDVILFKASRSLAAEKVIDYIKGN